LWHRGESAPRQHSDNRRGRWSDTSTPGHSRCPWVPPPCHRSCHDRALNGTSVAIWSTPELDAFLGANGAPELTSVFCAFDAKWIAPSTRTPRVSLRTPNHAGLWPRLLPLRVHPHRGWRRHPARPAHPPRQGRLRRQSLRRLRASNRRQTWPSAATGFAPRRPVGPNSSPVWHGASGVATTRSGIKA
jgi:hypothetical protein